MKRITLQLAALLLLASFCYAADTQIKDLTDGSGSVAGTWKVVCDNGTTTYICTANSLLALKIGTVTNAQICAGDSSGKIQCTTDPNTWAAAAHTHTGTYVPYSWIVQAGSNNVLTYTGDYSLGLTLTGNTSVTLPTSGTLATTSFKPSDLNIASQTAGDILYFNGTAWTRLAKDPGKYLKSGDSSVSWDTPAGGAGVDVSGTPANHYWTTWVDSDTIKGTSVTASKPVCTDSNGEPAACAGTEGVWAAVGQSNTFTENNTFGNADTDTLTLRSLLVGGNSRAVWIAGSAPTPTYATGTNELYVGGDIESGGNVYAANFISTGSGESYIAFGNNASGRSPTAGAYEMYADSGVFKLNQNGTEYSMPLGPTGGQLTFSGPTAARTYTLPDASTTILTTNAAVTPAQGGTGVANGSNNTITFTGNYSLGLTLTGNTAVTLPTSGTLATLGANTFTGTQALGTNNLTMTGSLAATDARVTKGWFTDIESTNMPTVGGTAILTSLTAPQFTTIELGHASDSTISRVSAGVLAIEGSNILTAGASPTLTGAWDFGGATSVEIPNGTGPTVDAAGEIAVDTTSDQLVYYGGAKRVLPYKQYASFVIPAPAATDDINLLKAPYGMTISAINCIVQGTTSVTGQLQECSSTGGDCADLDSDITCDADGAADDGSLTDSAIAANGWLRWKTTSVSGTPTFLTVTVTYSVVSD